jgi:hypothetical protein
MPLRFDRLSVSVLQQCRKRSTCQKILQLIILAGDAMVHEGLEGRVVP